MTETVSGGGLSTAPSTPLTRAECASLAEIAISARAGVQARRTTIASVARSCARALSTRSFRDGPRGQARNPYSRSWLWIPGSRFAHPGMTRPKANGCVATLDLIALLLFDAGSSVPLTVTNPSRRTLPKMSPLATIHAKISGPIVMIGFGSIGKGTLPLIERHFEYDKKRFVIIDPHEDGELAKQHNVRFIKQAVTKDNYRELLVPLLTEGGGQGFCVNLSVDTSSVDIMMLCREIGALYVDTVVEPWAGFYFDKNIGAEKRSNYALRETLLEARRMSPGGTTAVSTC